MSKFTIPARVQFCAEFKKDVSLHLSTCRECRESLTSFFHFITDEIPLAGFVLDRAGINSENILDLFMKGESNGDIEKAG